MFWRMLRGALVRQKRRMFMVALTVALGTSLTTAMLNVMLDVGDKVNRELKAYGANITVVPRSVSVLKDLYGVEAGPGAARQYLSEDDLGKIKTIFWSHNIVTFAPFLEAKAIVGQGGTEVALTGTWFSRRLELPTGEVADTGIKALRSWWEIDGAWVQDDDPKGIMVGRLLARKLGVRPGDQLEVSMSGQSGDKLTVRGVFSSGGNEDEQIFAPLGYVQQAMQLAGKVGKVEVSAITTPENELARRAAHNPKGLSLKEWETWYCTAYVSSIAYQIEEVMTGARAKPVRQVAESEGVILEKTKLLMLLITALSLAGSALGISNLLTAGVMERSREIGLLKALGATDTTFLTGILAETLAAGLAGGVAGYFSGLAFAQVIGRTVFDAAVTVQAMVVPLVAALVVLVILAGSLPSLRMLLALRPAEVLHGR